MTLGDLPTFIDPLQLARYCSHLTGRVALAQLLRVHDSLCDVRGDVSIDWYFAIDNQQRIIVDGYVQAQLPMICQRCRQLLEYAINAKVALIMLMSGQSEDDLPKGYEALTLTTTPISLISLLEDELILALPIVAKHMVCPSNEYLGPDNVVADLVVADLTPRHNPFEVLSQLRR
jgi:uncharacterized protein